jgi:hypothetical protein
MPPTTSLSDCLYVLGTSVLMAIIYYLFGWSGIARKIALGRFKAALALRKAPRPVDPDVASDLIRRYSRSPVAFLICWLPWLGMMSGSIGVSLIRDAGFVIVPWAILLPTVLFVLGTLIAARLKFLRLSRSLPVAPAP